MLSVIIPGCADAVELQRLLSDLVPAAVDGLVRDVLLTQPALEADCAAVCEDVGVVVVGGAFQDAVDAARSDRLLVLPANLRLGVGWDEALARHLNRGTVKNAVLMGRAAGLLRRRLFGVLIDRERLLAAGETPSLASLRRALGPGAARIG